MLLDAADTPFMFHPPNISEALVPIPGPSGLNQSPEVSLPMVLHRSFLKQQPCFFSVIECLAKLGITG